MERQLSFIGERRKKTESPGKRGDSPLHIAARTENLRKVKELIRSGCDGEELRELLSKQNFEGETPLYTAAENGHSAVGEEMLKRADHFFFSIKRLVFLILVVSGGEVEWSIHGYWSGAFTSDRELLFHCLVSLSCNCIFAIHKVIYSILYFN
ncbi:unnamed protein product [Brassica napus]|uniref:(rape) hypothetical protein n=1 Tax=Brassica napus TaxID=3708 RepID=A0A816WDQ5_BRANA|nr:unnamed protein product [Brassica napus]